MIPIYSVEKEEIAVVSLIPNMNYPAVNTNGTP